MVCGWKFILPGMHLSCLLMLQTGTFSASAQTDCSSPRNISIEQKLTTRTVFASLAPKTLAHELRETSDVEVARFMNFDVTTESLGINGTVFQNLTISELIVTPVGKRYKKAVWANETIHWKYIHQGEPTTNHSEVVWEEGDPETLPGQSIILFFPRR